ncbi:transcriptional regulator [Aquimarina gracilis]
MGFNAQSWDIDQDNNGLIYVANGDQILIFDGTQWKSTGTGFDVINRSLFVKNKDSIYFGADGQCGLLINKKYSDYEVVSLTTNNKDVVAHLEEYWRTHYIKNEVVFQTFRNLYVNHGNLITKIPAPYRFKWSYVVNDKLFVNDLKYGVFVLDQTNLLPVASDQNLNEHIIGITSIKDKLVVITDTQGLFEVDNEKLIPLDFPNIEKIKKAQIFSFSKLRDGQIALGTVSNGLYVLNPETGETFNINKKSGLQNNTILSIYQDKEDNLWLGLDYGIDYVKLNSPLTYFYDYYGELGTTYAVFKKKNHTYLGTNQGFYVTDNTSVNTEFELLLNGQVWNIEKVDEDIFVGHDKGAYLVKGKTLIRLGEDLGAWNFKKIKEPYQQAPFIVSGNYNGVSLYQNDNGNWNANRLNGFEKSARYLEVDLNNNIWVALRSEGVFRFELNYKTKSLEKKAFYPLKDFAGQTLSMSKVDNKIVITSNFNSYTYNYKKDAFDIVKIGKQKGDAPRIFKRNKEIWYVDDNNVTIEGENGLVEFHELKDQLIPGVLNIFALDKEHEIIPVFNGYSMYYKNQKTTSENSENDLLVRDFTSVNSSKLYFEGSEIPFSDNDLKINYSLPVYANEILYQTKFNDQEWSNWTTKTEQTLFNIKEGSYVFDMRAKYNGKIKEASLSFVINPPIYRTSWAYFLYILLFFGLIMAMVSFNRYKMRKQETMLLEQKAEKLKKQEEKHRSQKLEQERKIIELNNSKLQDEIKAKSRELTQIAYVNLNKNKILKKIRDRIVKIQRSSEQKLPTNKYNELLRLVEYYITDKESKLFEINFDKSHQEFYEKLSKSYPNLTSKDLRLCAYLKMNLSSKEIAPLLGISSQSVDVSRHRLRKKLNLDSKDNLTNILISLK